MSQPTKGTKKELVHQVNELYFKLVKNKNDGDFQKLQDTVTNLFRRRFDEGTKLINFALRQVRRLALKRQSLPL